MKRTLFLIFFILSNALFSQENGIYKSEKGQFILTISNFSRAKDYFNFKLEGSTNNQNCSCLEISGIAKMNGNDIVGFDYIENSTVFFTITPDLTGILNIDLYEENPELCGSCFEIDKVFKKVIKKKTSKK
jgi:hypothetical protein